MKKCSICGLGYIGKGHSLKIIKQHGKSCPSCYGHMVLPKIDRIDEYNIGKEKMSQVDAIIKLRTILPQKLKRFQQEFVMEDYEYLLSIKKRLQSEGGPLITWSSMFYMGAQSLERELNR